MDLDHPHHRTVAAYERYALRYAAAVPSQPSAGTEAALRRLAAALPVGGRVLEIGSGPGWDADRLEALGVPVHRTDATAAFRAFQQARGRRVDALDLRTDVLSGGHAGLMLMAVLQHFEREEVDALLAKLASAVDPGGMLLLSHPVGTDAFWEHGESGDYRVVRWSPAALDARLAGAGFAVVWQAEGDDAGDPWRTLLARRGADAAGDRA